METKDLCFVSDNLYIAFPDRVKAVHLRDAACAVAIVSINASKSSETTPPKWKFAFEHFPKSPARFA